MSQRRWILMTSVAVIAGFLWWRLAPESDKPAVAADSPLSANIAKPEIAVDPNPPEAPDAGAPNMATAPALLDLNVRSLPAIELPRKIDDQLSPSQARAMHQRAEDQAGCRLASDPDWTDTGAWERFTGTAWLGAAERARVLAGLRASLARLLAACDRQGIERSKINDDALVAEYWWQRASAAASGDLDARMVLTRIRRPAKPGPDPETQALVQEAISGGDAEQIGQAAALISRRPASFNLAYPVAPNVRNGQWSPPARFDHRALWILVACDLGMDCSASSRTLDWMCLLDALCGYPSVEAALRDGQISEQSAAETEARRQWIVERIRSRRGHELFAPIPVPAGSS